MVTKNKYKIISSFFVALSILLAGCGNSQQNIASPKKQSIKSIVEELSVIDTNSTNNLTADEAINEIYKRISYMPSIEKEIIKINNEPLLLLNASKHIYFDSGEYAIKSDKKMSEALNQITKRRELKINLIGHTDSVGDDKSNQFLSELRARTVYKKLINMGYPKDKIDYFGYGEEQPISTNKTEAGRAINRRVEIAISQPGNVFNAFINHRDINASYLNNHSEIEAGRVEVSIKGMTKNKNELEIKSIQKKLQSPKRKSFIVQIEKRKHFINIK